MIYIRLSPSKKSDLTAIEMCAFGGVEGDPEKISKSCVRF